MCSDAAERGRRSRLCDVPGSDVDYVCYEQRRGTLPVAEVALSDVRGDQHAEPREPHSPRDGQDMTIPAARPLSDCPRCEPAHKGIAFSIIEGRGERRVSYQCPNCAGVWAVVTTPETTRIEKGEVDTAQGSGSADSGEA